MSSITEQIFETIKDGQPVCVFPGDDARLLKFLSDNEPPNVVGLKPTVYCICFKRRPNKGEWPENYLFFGPEDDWETDLYRTLKANPMLPVPETGKIICFKEGFGQYIRGVFERVEMWRKRHLIDTLRNNWGRYAKWTYPTTPPRVMLSTSYFTTVLKYCTQDLAEGFKSLGCEVKVRAESVAWERQNRLSDAEAMDSFFPDLVVSVDGLRYPNAVDLPLHVPFAGWAQDRVQRLFDPGFVAAASKNDFQFAFWPKMKEELEAAGHKNVGILPAGFNPSVYKTGPVDPKFKCDIAFITNVVAGQDERRIADRLEEARRFVATGRKVHLYGNGWDGYEDLKPHWKGIVKQGDELRQAYAGARFVAQVNLDTNTHQRVFEAMGSGSVPLIRSLPSDKSDFDLHVGYDEAVRYVPFDLSDQLKRLDKKDIYDAYKAKGLARANKDHTYQARAKAILERVGQAMSPVQKATEAT